MKYKSELIHELLEQRGHEVPNLHYQSECIETWIEEYRGAYPKLCDYESEWLNYIVENPIGEFPYETVTTNSTATVNHVVPFAYKSAILSGNTLVNLFNKSQDSYTIEPTKNIGFKSDLYKTSTTYLIKFDVVSSNTNNKLMVQYYLNGQWLVNYELNIKLGINKFVITSISNQFNTIKLYYNPSYGSETVELKDIMLIEYQQGMENWDIPYFEGMQSVKMPVLTTTGKNLFDIVKVFKETNTQYDIGDDESYFFKVESKHYRGVFYPNTNKQLTITYEAKNDTAINFRIGFVYTDGSYNSANNTTSTTEFEKRSVTSNSNKIVKYIRFDYTQPGSVYIKNIQLEENSQATSYEPHKSNILSCLEPVELGSVGEVKDELNLLTQQLTQRTETRPYQEGDELNSEFVTDMTNTRYKLAQEVVKTVDLSITDENGNEIKKITPIEGTMHIQVSGTPIAPTAVLEVPVEAITQNLNSFIEEG